MTKALAMSLISSLSLMSKCFSSMEIALGIDLMTMGWFTSFLKLVVPAERSCIIGGATIDFVRASAVID